MKIYLDNCCFNRPYDEQSSFSIKFETEAKLIIQDLVRENKIDLSWSYILDYENDKNPDTMRKTEIWKWKTLSSDFVIEVDEIILKAEEIVKNGLNSFDALHLACAIHAKCDYFITVDRGILKKNSIFSEYLEIMNPIEFIVKLEG